MMKIESDMREMRVVGQMQLDDFTRDGWKLIYMIQETSIEGGSADRPCSGGTSDRSCCHNNYGACNQVTNMKQDFAVTTTKYLLGRPADDAMVEMATDLKSAKQSLHDSRKEVGEQSSEISKLHSRVGELERRNKQAKETNMELRARAVQAEKNARTIEEGLASEREKVEKLKNALGEKALG